jgi:enterochelin esterase family protein
MAQPDGIILFRDPRSHLIRLPGTDVWYRTHVLPATAEFSYQFSIGSGGMAASPTGIFRADPFNLLHYRILDGPIRSIARLPGVKPNPWVENGGGPTGQLRAHTLTSTILKTGPQRRIWVYRPPRMMRQPNLLVLLDGATYMNAVPTTRILDYLIAADAVGPTVVVFVADGDGDAWQTDLYYSDDFVAFLTDELLPWVQREYQFVASPSKTAIGGESIAGLTAAFAALHRPDVFAKVLAQSASFWLNNRDRDAGEPEWLARQFLSGPKLKVSFWIDVGQMEFVANEADRMFPPFIPGNTSLLAANRHLRDILRARCYEVAYRETYGAHEPLRWARTLPEGLLTLFGSTMRAPKKASVSYLNPACRTD